MVFLKMNNLYVLYEDNHIIVVEKKPNILSQGDITGDKDLLTMVKEYVKNKSIRNSVIYERYWKTNTSIIVNYVIEF